MSAARIDPARLEQLAEDPAVQSAAIARAFGMSRANFFVYLRNHEDLWTVYATARVRAGKQVTRASFLPRRGQLNATERKLLEVVAETVPPTINAIRVAAIAAGIEARDFSALLYNLEHEKHEIESREVERLTHYFVRVRQAKKEVA